jgi:hypothetical protein
METQFGYVTDERFTHIADDGRLVVELPEAFMPPEINDLIHDDLMAACKKHGIT